MSRKLKWGILGTAEIARSAIIPAIQESEYGDVVAIASRRAEHAAEVAEQMQIPRSYGSYEELLQDEEVEAVYIPLPNHLHKEWTIKAAQAGKHVLCEKPSSLNAMDTTEMVEACNQAGVVFAEGFMYRYHPKHQRIKEIINSGEIGDIRGIHCTFTFNQADQQGNVRFNREMGGGSIYDVGVYPISAARMYLDREPEAVMVHALYSPEHGDVDMMASGLLEFPGDVTLTFDCGMWAASRSNMEILGTKGTIAMPKMFGWEKSTMVPQIFVHTGTVTREERLKGRNSFLLQVEAFSTAVLEGKPLPYDPSDAILNMKVIDACQQSARERRRVELS
ncbi:Gfo/Idh/MocA family oxidoreductase [Paenibacillus sp. JX-17]|uniref:Gfo/Idh/MocA family oxidoreductase n=1 Tax=Paenibacillus lacisoli TaxID=3064525 RepID=A0ABT9C8X0_9BACL|nr:Gfo/Idh/MocA family oxidoreductase [Paenibacillus sp. JX-17]MDO7905703.1 Gfo/Idh/MocA family oxidoreductase [Paenibacillus sp. JX-17]